MRHGQAGTRDAYDSLSELGKRQARLLGEHFVGQRIQFASAYVGALSRQQQTAEQIGAAYANVRVRFPEAAVDAGWNEFDLARVYREISPHLSAEDSEFRREYEQMRAQIRINENEHGATIHRKWQPCDAKVVKAWISGRYTYSGETWDQFRQRVLDCRWKMRDVQLDENILVVTSATPIAIWTGLSLEIGDGSVMKLAGAMFNASYTILRLREEHQLRLITFNAAPHLDADGLRTHR